MLFSRIMLLNHSKIKIATVQCKINYITNVHEQKLMNFYGQKLMNL